MWLHSTMSGGDCSADIYHMLSDRVSNCNEQKQVLSTSHFYSQLTKLSQGVDGVPSPAPLR